MIQSASGKGYAQSGLWYYPGISGGCWRHFAQQQQNSNFNQPTTMQGSCVSSGEGHRVWQQTVYVGGSQEWAIRSNIDTTVFLQTSWNPWYNWNLPFIPDFLGETHHDESNVPGTASYPMTFANWNGYMQVQDESNDNWYDTCCYVNLQPYNSPRYSTDALSCDDVQVWTSG